MDGSNTESLVQSVRVYSKLIYPRHNLEGHIIPVVKIALDSVKYLPESDRGIVECGAYLHDIGRALLKGPFHEWTGAKIARVILPFAGFSEKDAGAIAYCIHTHGCQYKQRETPEATIVANADGFSHFEQFVYLFAIRYSSSRNYNRTRDWLMRKLDRDLEYKLTIPELRESAQQKLPEIERWVAERKY